MANLLSWTGQLTATVGHVSQCEWTFLKSGFRAKLGRFNS